jgi:hypothetical protein
VSEGTEGPSEEWACVTQALASLRPLFITHVVITDPVNTHVVITDSVITHAVISDAVITRVVRPLRLFSHWDMRLSLMRLADTDQILVKYWSNTGQILVRDMRISLVRPTAIYQYFLASSMYLTISRWARDIRISQPLPDKYTEYTHLMESRYHCGRETSRHLSTAAR